MQDTVARHSPTPQATLTTITARPVLAPFRLAPRSASGALTHAALVLIDVATSEGVTGRSYLFAFMPSMLVPLVETINALSKQVIGKPLCPLTLDTQLRKELTLLDTPGLVNLALSGLDMACWDAHCQYLQQPLARVLGSGVESVSAYNSCGLWIQSPETVAREARELLDSHGFSAVKLRIGRPDARDDLAAVRNVKAEIGPEINLMADFNQSQSVASATMRSRQLDNEGLYWIEEPVRHADFAGCASVRAAITTPVQIGENLGSSFELQTAINASAANLYMPDVQRIGGVTGWIRAAAICHANGLEMSSHLFPEISLHLLAATPTCHYLEYVDWANPILAEPVIIENGRALVPDRPGTGINWDEDAVAFYSKQL